MSLLFKVNGSLVKPVTEVLILEPFKSIWKRDRSKYKENAIKEFAYIEFMSSCKSSNPYKGLPEEERSDLIKENLFTKKWKPDKLVLTGINLLRQFLDSNILERKVLNSIEIVINKNLKFLEGINPEDKDEAGKLIYKTSDNIKAIIALKSLVENFAELQEKIDIDVKKLAITSTGIDPVNIFGMPESLDKDFLIKQGVLPSKDGQLIRQ